MTSQEINKAFRIRGRILSKPESMMQIKMKRRPTFKNKKTKLMEKTKIMEKPKPTPIKESLGAWLDHWEEIAK